MRSRVIPLTDRNDVTQDDLLTFLDHHGTPSFPQRSEEKIQRPAFQSVAQLLRKTLNIR